MIIKYLWETSCVSVEMDVLSSALWKRTAVFYNSTKPRRTLRTLWAELISLLLAFKSDLSAFCSVLNSQDYVGSIKKSKFE